jgi:hypothetical protein
MGNKAFLIGIIGGLGLGLLLGSEFSGTYSTIVGAILLIFTICFIIYAVFILKENKLESYTTQDKELPEPSERTYDDRRRESINNENREDISSTQRHRFRFIKK